MRIYVFFCLHCIYAREFILSVPHSVGKMKADEIVMGYKKEQEKTSTTKQKDTTNQKEDPGDFFVDYIKPIQILKEGFPNHQMEIQLEVERVITETERSTPIVKRMIAIKRGKSGPSQAVQRQMRILRPIKQPVLQDQPPLEHAQTHYAHPLRNDVEQRLVGHPLRHHHIKSIAYGSQSYRHPVQSYASQPDLTENPYARIEHPLAAPSRHIANEPQSLINGAQPLRNVAQPLSNVAQPSSNFDQPQQNSAQPVTNASPQITHAPITQSYIQPSQPTQAPQPLPNAAQSSAQGAQPLGQTTQVPQTFVQPTQQVSQAANLPQAAQIPQSAQFSQSGQISQSAQIQQTAQILQPQQMPQAAQISQTAQIPQAAQISQAQPIPQPAQPFQHPTNTFVQPAYPYSHLAQPVLQSQFPSHQSKEKKPISADDLEKAMDKLLRRINARQIPQPYYDIDRTGRYMRQGSAINIKPIVELLQKGVKIQHNVPHPTDTNLNWIQIKVPK